jgi:hypothetical protein
MRYYFTFGFGQKHADGFHVIEAITYKEARARMFDRFGKEWSMQYAEDEWFDEEGISQQEKYGLHEVR